MTSIGSIYLEMEHAGQRIRWRFSRDNETLDGVEVPTWIEATYVGGPTPDMVTRIELRDRAPRIVELSFIAQRDQNEVQQKHLRAVDVDRLATDLLAQWISWHFADAELPRDKQREPAERAAIKFLERQRLTREYRVIDDDFLRQVAVVYRENIQHAPTKAVAKRFGVKDRMASTYVDKARRAGHLPPTKQGQKRA
ncbi:hypothetical protein [Mycobacteroides chelonae]|jgi:hypothetical protein|uniref:Uncharacterized protein n=1 Tax=Mycobacteroides chelonae TaxID=1774 RepID=A0A1S1M3D6_MYCCH|nr:hypothetical protein [Mycobacteroides chelonae]MBF9315818.1 hypothetical protein [Mycobacteroides chelonae]OHT68265.1 hypothetical protein BKG66_18485 [Mycobacteroides chelonae]OHT75723.1 hypothetical protein BKG67_05915 [Mycobacteroides chelonae]OHT87329.1 hypothetical protein BKG70_12490 [Mycobacteroides chelonae]OHU77043.1 hypothetical protein BKG84_00085 [Mycobacteroides chelonae]